MTSEKVFSFSEKYKGEQIHVNLEFRSHVAVVSGDSGTGKTFIRNLATMNDNNFDWIDAVDVVRFKKVYDVESNKFMSDEQVIIIDNADYLLSLYPKMIQAINLDRYHYFLVYLRKPSVHIEVTPRNFGVLHFDEDTNTFSIVYPISWGA